MRECGNYLESLIKSIADNNVLQAKSVSAQVALLEDDEKKELEALIIHFIHEGISPEQQAKMYLRFCRITMEEQIYFSKMHQYRYHSFAEVEKLVYSNGEYMNMYMVALAISLYLWKTNREIFRFYRKAIHFARGNHFLEVGPGHGKYMAEAIKLGKYETYTGIDVSKTSVEICKRHLTDLFNWNGSLPSNCYLKCGDFFDFNSQDQFDGIVMGELLEHVEKPELFLGKAYDLATPEAFVFITVPINSPELDHIYLFRSIDEVEALIKQSGFKVKNKIAVTTNTMSLEQALSVSAPINTAYILTK